MQAGGSMPRDHVVVGQRPMAAPAAQLMPRHSVSVITNPRVVCGVLAQATRSQRLIFAANKSSTYEAADLRQNHVKRFSTWRRTVQREWHANRLYNQREF